MHRTRRVVTGQDNAGRSVVVSDGPASRGGEPANWPGYRADLLWSTPPSEGSADCDVTAEVEWVPDGSGTSRLATVTFPPDAVLSSPDVDLVLLGQEMADLVPGLAEKFEADHPGMHRTETTDYVVVLSGELWLELDDGAETRLMAGDVVIQNATRHAWRNKSDAAASILVALLGR